MRVLVTTFPGYGHFHPVAPLALAFQRAGHDVRVATHSEFGRWVESCGLPVIAAGRSERDAVGKVDGLAPTERAIQLFTTVAVPPFVADVLEATKRWRPELVVSEEGEYAGPLIASVLGLPSVTHSWPAPARPLQERIPIEDALSPIWRQFGQPGPARAYGDAYLDCCPPPLQTTAIDSIDEVTTVQPSLFDGPPDAAADRLVADVAHPVAFVTLGTVELFARAAVLQLLVEAVATEAATVIVATGPNAASVIPEGKNVRRARYVPLSAVLPLTDLVVSHGGASTTVACLIAGVPQLIVPQGAASQRRAAEGVAALGVGASLGDRSLDLAIIRGAVRSLLDDRDIPGRLATVRATLDRLPNPDEVVRHLTRRLPTG